MAAARRGGDPSVRAVEEVVQDVATDLGRGLSAAEAARRLEADGPNALRSAARKPKWRKVLAQFQDPLIYLLLAAVVVSVGAWWLEGRHGWPIDALVIAVIVLLNAILGFVQEARAENAIAALQKMTAATSSVLRDGIVARVPNAELVVGDVLELAEGDAVGADARVVEANVLRVQESSLTGESGSVSKESAALAAPAALGDRIDMVFKGTSVAQGTGRAVVTATGMDTEMGAIATMLAETPEDPTPLQVEIARIGRMLGIAVVIIAVVVVTTLMITSHVHTVDDAVTALLLGVSLAVAAVPEGLPAILSTVLAIGVLRMSRRNALVKGLSSVETLGSATVICSDKTGTLTRSEMTIQRIVTASGQTWITGVGYVPEGTVEHDGAALVEGPLLAEDIAVISGGSVASNADLRLRDGEWEIHGDPTEAAFLVAEHKMGVDVRRKQRFERIAEIPFSSTRKRMSTLAKDHEDGDRVVLITKGAPGVLLERCTHVRFGLEVRPLDDALRQRILADVDALTDAALRTLSVAYRSFDGEAPAPDESLENDLIFVGTVGMIDPPRPEAAAAVKEAHRAGIRVMMITGDHPRTAARIAADLGIVEKGTAAVTGLDLDAMDDAAFAATVRVTSVYARVSPVHKLRIVDALQADGNVVAMTGDGVNDAPALKSADIGVAMGLTGTEVTKEAAKMILADDNFATIVSAVHEGRRILDNIRKFLRYLLSSNMGEVLTVFFGVVGAGALGLRAGGEAVVVPLLATQILWINLITDSAPALAMGIDRETDDVMARPPRGRNDRVIDARMWSGVLMMGVAMAALTLASIDLYLPGGLFEGDRDLDSARTVGFTVMVFSQLFNCFNARSDTISAFSQKRGNPWLWGAVGLSVVLQVAVVHVPFLNVAFGTVPLDLTQWAVCVAMASGVLWFGELRKLVLRMFAR